MKLLAPLSKLAKLESLWIQRDQFTSFISDSGPEANFLISPFIKGSSEMNSSSVPGPHEGKFISAFTLTEPFIDKDMLAAK